MDLYYSDKDFPLRCVKYWDEEQKEIVYSAKPREEPYPLSKLLGYYEWVYNGYFEVDREIEPGSHGYLQLGLKVKATDENVDVDPAHVVGEFDTCGIGSGFVSLEESDLGWVFDQTNLVEDSEGPCFEEFDFHKSEFCIIVVDALDDNGNPFVEFTHSGDDEVVYVGKKQQNATLGCIGKGLEGLTEGERKRLGIYVEDAEVKRVALKVLGKKPASSNAGNAQKRRAEEDSSEQPPWKK